MFWNMAAYALLTLQQGPAARTVPMREEPYHRPVFENQHVAVYDVRLPVGAVMRYHEHPTNHLAVVIDSGVMRNEILGRPGKINPTGLSGTVVYLAAGPPHRQTNIGRTPVHFIAVEVLEPLAAMEDGKAAANDPPKGADQRAAPDRTPGCRVVIDKSDVRAWRCLLPPGQASMPRPDTGPFLRVLVSRGLLQPPDPSGGSRPRRLAAGAAAWHDSASAVAVKNAGSAPVEFVDLEWKPCSSDGCSPPRSPATR